MSNKKYTQFGFQKIRRSNKSEKISQIFTSVSEKYDLMNSLMSFNIHKSWQKFSLVKANIRPWHQVLDVASGTGDMALLFLKNIGKEGKLTLTDIYNNMLELAKKKIINYGVIPNISYIISDAEQLPFPENQFDCINISFGLRNVSDKIKCLKSMLRILKPGGRLLILDFSKPTGTISYFYYAYLFTILPLLGKIILNDEQSYRYLAESICVHPDQASLKKIIYSVGFDRVDFFNLSGGIACLHMAYKY